MMRGWESKGDKQNGKSKPYIRTVTKVKGGNCFVTMFTIPQIPLQSIAYPFPLFLHGLSI